MRHAPTDVVRLSADFPSCERGIITSEAEPIGSASLVAVFVLAVRCLFCFALSIVLLKEEVVVGVLLHVKFSHALVKQCLEFFYVCFLTR